MYARHKYKEDLPLDQIKDPAGSIKYDGSHFFIKFDEEGKPSFISRRMSVKGHYPDRTEKLPQFHDIKLPQFAGHIYASELIHSGFSKYNVESHPTVSGILNSLPTRAIETQKTTGPVRAVLLDVIHPRLPTYKDKIDHLKALEQAVGKPDLLFAPELKIGHANIHQLIETTKREGREGVIATSLSIPEEKNPRLKVKHFQTFNLKIRGITQEIDKNGTPKNSMGALELEDAKGRYVGNVGTGFSRDLREEIFNNKPAWLGRLIQVKAMWHEAHKSDTRVEPNKIFSAVYNGEPDGHIDVIL